MKIQTFRNGKGLIYGPDSKRIGCDLAGVLKIGNTEVIISPEENSIMPLLFNGCTGDYNAIFTTKDGKVYELEKVAVKGGRIAPPPPISVEFMEIRCRMDAVEEKCDKVLSEIQRLDKIFDTNALNFLIK